jgi:hypothetical protein
MSLCALWYTRHHAPGFELCDSEEDAARRGIWMEEHGEAVVLGVQFTDGHAVARGDWAAWQDAQRRLTQEYEARLEAQVREPRETREIRDPFVGQSLVTNAFTPAWLGKQRD